jgi:hypothetical protein
MEIASALKQRLLVTKTGTGKMGCAEHVVGSDCEESIGNNRWNTVDP